MSGNTDVESASYSGMVEWLSWLLFQHH